MVPLNGLVDNDVYLEVTAMNDSGVIIGRSGGHAVLWGEVAEPVSVLDFSNATVTRKGKTVTITVKTAVTNPSSESALNTFVNAAMLGASTPTTSLPLKIGTIKPGASKTVSLTFKNVLPDLYPSPFTVETSGCGGIISSPLTAEGGAGVIFLFCCAARAWLLEGLKLYPS